MAAAAADTAADTAGFVFNHSKKAQAPRTQPAYLLTAGPVVLTAMFRVRDPAASLDFYTRVLGMT
jgi:hypothetical protein